ncbi:MAG: hypothetical protein GC152_03975 [Alphaproteobacteria bacterium]|nr:hypothetical protein [Alphaproteobacteria bacterium]
MGIQIITIHGTGDGLAGATGEERWWEPTGTFAEELRAAVEEPIEIIPFKWSGENSENDRATAAVRLFRELHPRFVDRRDGEQGHVHLISHSHGGNVGLKAIAESLRRVNRPSRIASWTNIATPFFSDRLSFNPINRYGLGGVMGLTLWAIGALAAAGAVVFLSLALMELNGDELAFERLVCADAGICDPSIDEAGAGDLFGVFLAQLAFTAAQVGLGTWLVRSAIFRKKFGRRRRGRERMQEFINARMANVYHAADEAILLLKTVSEQKFRIVSSKSISRNVRTAFFVVVPMLSFALMLALAVGASNSVDAGNFDSMSPLDTLKAAFEPPASRNEDALAFFLGATISVGIFALPIIATIAYLVYTLTLRIIVENGLLTFLNGTVRAALKGNAFGNDMTGLIVRDVGPSPFSQSAQSFRPLPSPLADALEAHVASYAADTLSRARRIISMEGQLGARSDATRTLLETMSWNELAHTAYFRVPAVRKFIIFAFIRTAGLTPSESFQSDPDWDRMDAWLKEIAPV